MESAMKHAWLIIAHNEFEVLRLLLESLDDERNDIYVHLDRKVKKLPELSTAQSRLTVLHDVDVRWGTVSQLRAEFLLFETALQSGGYAYFHLISGTHLPLKPVREIDDFFEKADGCSLLTGLRKDEPYQETLKMRRLHFFLKYYAAPHPWVRRLAQYAWRACIALQKVLHITVHVNDMFYKASQWVSLTDEAVSYLVARKKHILRKYRFSFCGDEFFVPSELLASPLKEKIRNCEVLLKQEMGRAHPGIYALSEWDTLKNSGYLFARKFTSDDLQ